MVVVCGLPSARTDSRAALNSTVPSVRLQRCVVIEVNLYSLDALLIPRKLDACDPRPVQRFRASAW